MGLGEWVGFQQVKEKGEKRRGKNEKRGDGRERREESGSHLSCGRHVDI